MPLFLGVLLCDFGWAATGEEMALLPGNVAAPFCYASGGIRRWSLVQGSIPPGVRIELRALSEAGLPEGSPSETLQVQGLRLTVSPQGRLQVMSDRIPSRSSAAGSSLRLQVSLFQEKTQLQTQTLILQPAAPSRPIVYYSDLADDLIWIFGTGVLGKPGSSTEVTVWSDRQRPAPPRDEKLQLSFPSALYDPYFRRLQCQGTERLIVWPLPFSLLAPPSAYSDRDWERFEAQARAILESPRLRAILTGKLGFHAWAWLRDLIAFHLDPKAGAGFADSAQAHGIPLSLSFRPLEPAISKYYEVPAFDADGGFLWNFLPLASPQVNYHSRELGFANWREILVLMGLEQFSRVESIEIPLVAKSEAFLSRFQTRGDNLRIRTSHFPPLQPDSLVLQRRPDQRFRLVPYSQIQEQAELRQWTASGFKLHHQPGRGLIISGLTIPQEHRYILLDNPSGSNPLRLPRGASAILRSSAGTVVGRTQSYWSFPGSGRRERATQVAGIPTDAGHNAVFFASEASAEYRSGASGVDLDQAVLVIDRGERYTPEILDFNLGRTRELVVRELASVLRHPAFSEIYINTRSHTQLAGSLTDGPNGIRPKANHDYRGRHGEWVHGWENRRQHLGIDLGYAPRHAARDNRLRALASSSSTVERITTWQSGEFQTNCQSEGCPSRWRTLRNRGVASGIRLLLEDLAGAFPDKKLRVVLPERQGVRKVLAQGLRKDPTGGIPYTADRNNWVPHIGEGMADLDLVGLNIEPVLLGTGPFVDAKDLERYLDQALKERSPLPAAIGVMYEGQWTLRPHTERARLFVGEESSRDPDQISRGLRRAREERICRMLARPELRHVILYEARDWVYFLPDSDPFSFVDRCDEILE